MQVKFKPVDFYTAFVENNHLVFANLVLRPLNRQ